jgi:hypothetical protein
MIAEGAATVVLREMKIEGLRVDPIEIATRKGIVVEPKPSTVKGVSGMLVKAGDTFGIMYATHVSSKGFPKFCVAHELGGTTASAVMPMHCSRTARAIPMRTSRRTTRLKWKRITLPLPC